MPIPAGFSFHPSGFLFRQSDSSGPYVNVAGGTPELVTGDSEFRDGREFRAYLELSVGAGLTTVIRVTAAAPFTLTKQALSIDDGTMRFAAIAGTGTPGGSFSVPIPTIGKNRQLTRPTPFYVSQVVLETGGTITGGTEVEVFRLKAAAQSQQQTTVGGSIETLRALPAGTYYLKFENLATGTVAGVYTLEWAEP